MAQMRPNIDLQHCHEPKAQVWREGDTSAISCALLASGGFPFKKPCVSCGRCFLEATKMKRLAISLLAGVAALSFISSVQAADLIIEEPPVVGIVDVGGNWDGVYVGAFAGYGWGTVNDDDGYFVAPDTEYDLTGWQVGDRKS